MTGPRSVLADGHLPRGHARVEVAVEGGRSVVRRVHAESPLRILTPRSTEGVAAWVVMSSFGGGLVDGDDLRVELAVRNGASALLTTQASTKVYRGDVGARQSMTIDVEPHAIALVLPDPTACFTGARFVQDATIDLADGTSALVWLEVLTAGRIAHGERWDVAHLSSRLTIRCGGATWLRDAIELDGAHGDLRARMSRFEAIGTLVVVGDRFAEEAHAIARRAAAPSPNAPTVFAASPLGPHGGKNGVVARFAAIDVAHAISIAREATSFVGRALGVDPWARRT